EADEREGDRGACHREEAVADEGQNAIGDAVRCDDQGDRGEEEGRAVQEGRSRHVCGKRRCEMSTRAIKAVGYARRSTDMQERSIPDQQSFVQRWAKENGYSIERWYVDDAISGTSAKGRVSFERMMKDAEGGGFAAVLCYDMSRFSRGGTNETGYYLHRLSMAGVQVIFCAEG